MLEELALVPGWLASRYLRTVIVSSAKMMSFTWLGLGVRG